MHRQVREPPLAPEHRVQFGDFLVALVVAAFGDEFARDGELRAGFLLEPRGLGGVGARGSGGAGFEEAVQRREGFAAREREPRAFQRDVAEVEPHRPRLRDLLDLVEIARGGGEVADAVAEGGAGEEAAGKKVIGSGSAEAFDGLAKQSASVAGAIARGPGR